jgi:sulfite exporter TauE/SafE
MDWLLIFVGGFLGSSHCVGMCGGFALALGSAGPSWAANVPRQLCYSLGRVFTYASAGAAAGYGGWRLVAELRPVVNLQAVLSITAGVLLVVQGLAAAGVGGGIGRRAGSGPCLGSGFFAAWLRAARWHSVFLGGVVNGLLPCGLVYAYLALAGSSGDMLRGMAVMALFGLGTVPVMVLVGSGGSVLNGTSRRRLLRLAAWCVVLTGLITIVRGVGFLPGFSPDAGPECPLCR